MKKIFNPKAKGYPPQHCPTGRFVAPPFKQTHK